MTVFCTAQQPGADSCDALSHCDGPAVSGVHANARSERLVKHNSLTSGGWFHAQNFDILFTLNAHVYEASPFEVT